MSWSFNSLEINPLGAGSFRTVEKGSADPKVLFQEIQGTKEYQEDSQAIFQRAKEEVRTSHFASAYEILESLIKGVVKA